MADTNQFGYYLLSDVYRDCTTKEFYQVRQLANDWKFTKNTRSLTLPNGRIFAINCRTTSSFIDPYFYEITDTKASNRGTLPTARRDSSFIYLGQHLYVIGGKAEGQKSSRHSYKYNLKTKKWS